MAAIHETAYPRIKPNLNYKEQKEIFTPTAEELFLLETKTKKTLPISRLGFMITLKCYQYLGHPIKVQKLDTSIRKYIAERIEVDQATELNNYSKLTRHRHLKVIREFLKINPDKKERRKIMKKVALDAATTRENLADIINCVIDELIKSRFELPAFQKLVRLARAARTVVNNDNYGKIFNSLSEEQKRLIDITVGLVKPEENDDAILSWQMLKLEPKKPTTNNIKGFVQYVNKMRILRKKINIILDFIALQYVACLKK